MTRKTRNILIGVICVVLVVAGIILLAGGSSDFKAKYADTDLSQDNSGMDRKDTYNGYLAAHQDVASGKEAIEVDLTAFEGEA